jgi:4-diphosphocytidyl-2C-methyl-D-erythritol kinase
VTPRVAVATAAVFAAHDAIAGAGAGDGGGATRTSSSHLADELRAGLTARALVDRAGVLAVANDLIPATRTVVPGLVGLRRSLGRLVGRPVGQSGSGPSLWVLYPSLMEAEVAAGHVRTALAQGTLLAPGEGPPFVAATEILAHPDPDRSQA